MHYSIMQTGPTTWELRAGDGTVVATFADAGGRTGYDLALLSLSGILRDALAASDEGGDAMTSADGLLPERWVSDAGLAFQERLPGGRDFSQCAWTWRDPAQCLVPLMMQTETDFGHMGAELAGFCEEFSLASGTVSGAGRFYDSECGRCARDVLLDGRRFGVSVDPDENIEAEFQCTDYDDDGWCLDGDTVFLAYEIAGVTMTPFPGFEHAAIVLDPATVQSADAPAPMATAPTRVAASAVPTAPPASWFALDEPRPGVAFLDGMGDDVLVAQSDGSLACPLTIDDNGQVYGHITRWGQCHTGEPWGPGVCAAAQRSASAYSHFQTGTVRCDDGTSFATGSLVVGCEHSDASSAWAAMDYYANAGNGWADVRVIDGEYGPWICGSLRPDLTDSQLRVLRALSLSGEWRSIGGNLELIGVLAVNTPGLPVERTMMAASGFAVASPNMRMTTKGGEIVRLAASGIVTRCPDCERRRAEARSGRGDNGLGAANAFNAVLDRLDAQAKVLAAIDARTRHLVPVEAESVARQLHAVPRS